MLLRNYPIITRPTNSFDMFDEMDKVAGDMFKKSSNYPPFNIYTLDGTDTPIIEMSVIGFSKDEIEVEYLSDEGELQIKGTHKENEGKKYAHRGLSMKNFTRVFAVNQNLSVDDVSLDSGLLTITFKRNEKKTISYDIQ
jgi:HSP20 family molecular chaperone IbpA